MIKDEKHKFIDYVYNIDRTDYSHDEMLKEINRIKELCIDPLSVYRVKNKRYNSYSGVNYMSNIPLSWLNTYEMQHTLIELNSKSFIKILEFVKKYNRYISVHQKIKEENSWYYESNELGLL